MRSFHNTSHNTTMASLKTSKMKENLRPFSTDVDINQTENSIERQNQTNNQDKLSEKNIKTQKKIQRNGKKYYDQDIIQQQFNQYTEKPKYDFKKYINELQKHNIFNNDHQNLKFNKEAKSRLQQSREAGMSSILRSKVQCRSDRSILFRQTLSSLTESSRHYLIKDFNQSNKTKDLDSNCFVNQQNLNQKSVDSGLSLQTQKKSKKKIFDIDQTQEFLIHLKRQKDKSKIDNQIIQYFQKENLEYENQIRLGNQQIEENNRKLQEQFKQTSILKQIPNKINKSSVLFKNITELTSTKEPENYQPVPDFIKETFFTRFYDLKAFIDHFIFNIDTIALIKNTKKSLQLLSSCNSFNHVFQNIFIDPKKNNLIEVSYQKIIDLLIDKKILIKNKNFKPIQLELFKKIHKPIESLQRQFSNINWQFLESWYFLNVDFEEKMTEYMNELNYTKQQTIKQEYQRLLDEQQNKFAHKQLSENQITMLKNMKQSSSNFYEKKAKIKPITIIDQLQGAEKTQMGEFKMISSTTREQTFQMDKLENVYYHKYQ